MSKSAHPSVSAVTASLAGLQTLMKTFDTMMLATIDLPGTAPRLHARLMSVASVDDGCTLSFFTAGRDELVDGHGHVVAQAKTCSLNLIGSFSVITDRAQMAPFFSKSHEAWFPQGLDEPGLCMVTFRTQQAELRDMARVQHIHLAEPVSASGNPLNLPTRARAVVSAVAVVVVAFAAMQAMAAPAPARALSPDAQAMRLVGTSE